jgi:hypothetical protein
MSSERQSWVRLKSEPFAEIEAETRRVLGERSYFFINVANDWMDVTTAIGDVYPGQYDLVQHAAFGLWKEMDWLHFLFVAGNYPLVLARLRHIWELVYRAALAENYIPSGHRPLPAPGASMEEKLRWLDRYGGKLDWNRCIEPVLRSVFPLANREPEVLAHYARVWKRLQYVHPSTLLTGRLVEASGLHVRDNFDEEWADETLRVAANVFDVVWFTIFDRYPRAFDRLEKLHGGYPTLGLVFERANRPA